MCGYALSATREKCFRLIFGRLTSKVSREARISKSMDTKPTQEDPDSTSLRSGDWLGSYADCAHALVCADWIMRFREACDKAGGGSWKFVKRMTVEEAMHMLAPNGIRFCYDDAAHIKNMEDAAAMMSNAIQFLPKDCQKSDRLTT